jgi:hypothetical protein
MNLSRLLPAICFSAICIGAPFFLAAVSEAQPLQAPPPNTPGSEPAPMLAPSPVQTSDASAASHAPGALSVADGGFSGE